MIPVMIDVARGLFGAAGVVAVWWWWGLRRPVTRCLACHGTGRARIVLKVRCPACHGTGQWITYPARITGRASYEQEHQP